MTRSTEFDGEVTMGIECLSHKTWKSGIIAMQLPIFTVTNEEGVKIQVGAGIGGSIIFQVDRCTYSISKENLANGFMKFLSNKE